MPTGNFDSTVNGAPAVRATGTNGANGIEGTSDTSGGVVGTSNTSGGVIGYGGAHVPASAGVIGFGTDGYGVVGNSVSNVGTTGNSGTGTGVGGGSDTGTGVYGLNRGGGIGVVGTGGSVGVQGNSVDGYGVIGNSTHNTGTTGNSGTGTGVYGEGRIGVHGKNIVGDGGRAGYFDGDVEVTGDIRLTNADCAEDFDISGVEKIEPGTVMVIDQEGALRQSEKAYDKRVAGVISGADGHRPGIILDRQQSSDNRMPIALVGKVYCKVDAQYAPIEVGDLLTTSPTPGYAMKAGDPLKAFGSVIGKALHPLEAGQALIPILIALQ